MQASGSRALLETFQSLLRSADVVTDKETATPSYFTILLSRSGVGIAAAVRYLDTNNHLSGKIALTGLGTPNSMKQVYRTARSRHLTTTEVENLL
jgi:hypothetical protein